MDELATEFIAGVNEFANSFIQKLKIEIKQLETENVELKQLVGDLMAKEAANKEKIQQLENKFSAMTGESHVLKIANKRLSESNKQQVKDIKSLKEALNGFGEMYPGVSFGLTQPVSPNNSQQSSPIGNYLHIAHRGGFIEPIKTNTKKNDDKLVPSTSSVAHGGFVQPKIDDKLGAGGSSVSKQIKKKIDDKLGAGGSSVSANVHNAEYPGTPLLNLKTFQHADSEVAKKQALDLKFNVVQFD